MPQMTASQAPPVSMQGIAVPASSVQPQAFFHKTRRNVQQETTRSYNSGGSVQDVVELRKSGILSTITIKFSGTLVVTPGSGSVASTARWPYDLLQSVRYTANNASNLINCSGLKLKAREIMRKDSINDRGISRVIGGQNITQGTLSTSAETWGVGAASTGLTAGSYPVELTWVIPVAEDEVDLSGATFLATSTADLTVTANYQPFANLFTTTGAGAVSLTGTFSYHTTKFTIPIGPDGNIVVPDLSMFHSIIQSSTTSVQTGDNEVRIVGQGAGKSLLRLYYQLWNGAGSASAPLQANAANFGTQGWRYGTNEQPDSFADGMFMREFNERQFGSDLGGAWGFLCHDFASELEFRDVVQMGQAGELRLASYINNSVALASPSMEYVVESVFSSGQAS